MGISIGGLISGMDTDKIITQLLGLQKKPILQLQRKEADYRVKLSAYSTLQGSLQSVKTAARNMDSVLDIKSYLATSGNTDLVVASAQNSAGPGSYSITVNSLATAHKLTSMSFIPTEAAGMGTIHLSMGSNDPVDIEVGSDSTISDIARAINDAGVGIYASLINDGTSSFLTLTGKQTGGANVISLTVTEDGTLPTDADNQDLTGLSRLVFDNGGTKNLTQLQGAANSDINIDGVANISSPTNVITDVISGVTLNLKAADPLKQVIVTVERSDELFTTRLNAFLDAYNGLVDSLKNLRGYDPQTQKAGTLFGDSTTRRIHGDIQRLISNSVPGLPVALSHMTDLGVSTNEEGKLKLDAGVFNTKLKDSFDDVVKFFTKTDNGEGFAVRMASSLEKIMDLNGGALSARTKGIQASIKSIGSQIEKMNVRLVASEARLRAQFSSLELLLGKYQSTSDALTRQLDALNNLNEAMAKR